MKRRLEPAIGLDLDSGAINRLMPMHLALNATGEVISVGSTLCKIMPEQEWIGHRFFELFRVKRPGRVTTLSQLLMRTGQPITLSFRDEELGQFRGAVVPLAAGQGLLMNLSFGAGVLEAVRRHRLSEADFAPTDLAVELLYLIEVKTTLMDDLRQKNARLEGEKTQAEAEALTDPLTRLRNRRALDAVLERLILSGADFAMMHLDLDFFKEVNDTLGHAAGDYVLQRVSAILRQETRESDTVARIGGDEFVIILPGVTNAAKLRSASQRIIDQVMRPMEFEGQRCRISVSIGMTVSRHYKLPNAAEMLADADMALYASKKAGRGRARMFQSLMPKAS